MILRRLLLALSLLVPVPGIAQPPPPLVGSIPYRLRDVPGGVPGMDANGVVTNSAPHVANNAALKASLFYATIGIAVVRDGYLKPGDGGRAIYTYSSAACSAPDDGYQSAAVAGGCWTADLSGGRVTLQLWGGVADDASATGGSSGTDNSPAFNKAIAALSNGAGSNGLMPAVLYLTGGGTGRCYRTTGTISITASGITLDADPNTCVDYSFAGDAVDVGNNTAANNPGSVAIKNIAFRSLTYFHAPRVVNGVTVVDAAIRAVNTQNLVLDNITCVENGYICADIDNLAGTTQPLSRPPGANQFQTHIDHMQCYAGFDCIRLGATGAVQDTFITNSIGTNLSNAGIDALSAGGVMVSHNDFYGVKHGWYAHPGPLQYVGDVRMADNYFDTTSDIAVLIDATGGGIISPSHYDGVWAATCGSVGNPVACIQFQGSASNLLGQYMNVSVFNAAGHGVFIAGGTDIHITGSIVDSGQADAATPQNSPYVGLLVGAGVSHWSFVGRAGGASPPFYNTQAYGVEVLGGASDYYQIAGDLSGNLTGGLLDGGQGTHKLTSQILQ